MLEYCHDTTLQLLPEPDLQRWVGTVSPHHYLTLVRTAKLLTHCPTILCREKVYIPWLCDRDERLALLNEFGLAADTTMVCLRQVIQSYLDEPWSMTSCTYRYNGKTYVLTGVMNARNLWACLARHSMRIVVTVNPSTLLVNCRPMYYFTE